MFRSQSSFLSSQDSLVLILMEVLFTTVKSTIALIGSITASGTFLFQMGLDPQIIYLVLLFGSLMGGITAILLHSGKEGTSQIKSKFLEVFGLICVALFCGMFVVEFTVYYFNLRQLIEKGEISEWFVYSGVIFFGGSVVAGGRIGLERVLSILTSILQLWAEKYLSTRRKDDDDE
jgi:hypothetical protein